MKKILIFLSVMVLLTGCTKEDSNKDEKEKNDKTIEVTDGKMKTEKYKGFSFDLKEENGDGIVIVTNKSAKAKQAYSVNLTIYQKDGNPINSVATIPPDLDKPFTIYTMLKANTITSIDYEVTETTLEK